MKTSPKFLNLTKAQRKGMIWTLILFLLIHFGIVFYPKNTPKGSAYLQLDSLAQMQIEVLAAKKQVSIKDAIYPFNPNYITDFKAYQLGISMEVVYRIRAYRDAGNYITSEKVFQQLAELSNDELLRIRPYLKLPKPIAHKAQKPKNKRIKKQLNSATTTDLQQVYGIGEAYANRIISARDKLGGFIIKDQLNDIWGLSPETQQRLWEHFVLDSIPIIRKQNINNLTIAQLAQHYYVSASLASSIVAVRTQKEHLSSWNDLAIIQQLDSVKKARLSLYLSFN
ncbi:MAG: hypothetical protein GWO82_04380 [Bacteroidetes bacterium]|nr:hypothetical protein [Bacteroidota bacterium]